MAARFIGTRFQTYRQYCDMADHAMASMDSPLSGGLPDAAFVRDSIALGRLFFLSAADQLLIFHAYVDCFQMYFIAEAGAVLAIPSAGAAVITEQVRPDRTDDPAYDALMVRSGLAQARIHAEMTRSLLDAPGWEQYTQQPATISARPAIPGEMYHIATLLRTSFDPALDALPGQSELLERIENLDVLVIRDHAKVAALAIRIPVGDAALLRWLAVDAGYKDTQLGGWMHYAHDTDAQARGYKESVLWTDAQDTERMHTLEQYGYRRTGQWLYTYRHTV